MPDARCRGFPVDRLTRAQTVATYYAFGLLWGEPQAQNAKGHILGHIKVSDRWDCSSVDRSSVDCRVTQQFASVSAALLWAGNLTIMSNFSSLDKL